MRKVGGENLCDLFVMGSERKRRQQQVLATELWMKLEGLELEGQKEVKICSQHTCSPGRSAPWISRGCLMELGARIKQSVEKRDWEGKNSGFHQSLGQRNREGCSRCSVAKLGVRLRDSVRGRSKGRD